jgi:hypothetical protein
VTYFLFAGAGILALVIIASNLMATVSLIRTSQLTRFQKIAQGVIVWCVPFIGAWLVLHLIGQSDRDVIPRWIPNDSINEYVFQLLGIEGKIATHAVEHELEQTVGDFFTGHSDHSGGGESGGGHGTH